MGSQLGAARLDGFEMTEKKVNTTISVKDKKTVTRKWCTYLGLVNGAGLIGGAVTLATSTGQSCRVGQYKTLLHSSTINTRCPGANKHSTITQSNTQYSQCTGEVKSSGTLGILVLTVAT